MATKERPLTICDIGGWLLVAPDDNNEEWSIAWTEPFKTKKSALRFATSNHWPKPFKAMRGRLMVDPQ